MTENSSIHKVSSHPVAVKVVNMPLARTVGKQVERLNWNSKDKYK